jgi:DNA ligase-1
MEGTIIYKRTSTGATQQWHMERDGEKIRTISGQVGGKLVTADWTVCEGTNIGRSNERTPEEQAEFQINAKYKKKLDKEYCLDINNIDTPKIFIPMLAKEYDNYKAKVFTLSSAVYVQPKLDGMRCVTHGNNVVINKEGMWSRQGKPIITCPHIWEELESLFLLHPNVVLDGELYNHEFKEDFNSLISILKKQKPTEEHYANAKKYAQYHVYDMPSHVGDFSRRSQFLKAFVKDMKYIHFVETVEVIDQSLEEIDRLYNHFLEQGYEGMMVRQDTPYVNKRSNHLLKMKEEFDKEYIVVDIETGVGNWAGKAKRVYLQHDEKDVVFKAGVKGTQEYCAQVLIDKEQYIGKPATVVFNAFTPDGIPRFGRVKEFDRQDNI